MLSGIISDTLILMSPTTTKLDKEIVKDLAKIAGVNYSEYGMNMFKAGSSLEGMSKTDVLYNDFKKFTTNSGKLGIGQIFTMDIDCIKNELDEYVNMLDEVCKRNITVGNLSIMRPKGKLNAPQIEEVYENVQYVKLEFIDYMYRDAKKRLIGYIRDHGLRQQDLEGCLGDLLDEEWDKIKC